MWLEYIPLQQGGAYYIYKLLYGPIVILVGPELIILGPFCVFTLSLFLLAPIILNVAPLKKVGTYFFKWPHT